MVTYPIVLALRSAPLLCSRWIWIWIKVIHSDRTRNAAVHDDEDDEDEWCPAEEHTHAAVAGAADRDAQWCFRRIFILLSPRWSGDSSASCRVFISSTRHICRSLLLSVIPFIISASPRDVTTRVTPATLTSRTVHVFRHSRLGCYVCLFFNNVLNIFGPFTQTLIFCASLMKQN